MPLKPIPIFVATLVGVVAMSASSQGLPPPPSSADTSNAALSTAAGPAVFDVASVHEHGGDDHNMSWRYTASGLATSNIPLQSLIASAYNVKMDLVSGGPSWVDSKGFDIEAKVLSGEGNNQPKLSAAQQRVLLRALLADRFHLKAHVESKTLPVYELVVARGGPKMELAPPAPPVTPSPDSPPTANKERGSMSFAPGHLEAHAYKVSGLASQLGYMVQRTVIDKTGLTGEYNLTLDWTPEEQLQAASDKATTGTDPKPSIYAALPEQLGLKLVPTKGSVDTLVIDHVELPTAN